MMSPLEALGFMLGVSIGVTGLGWLLLRIPRWVYRSQTGRKCPFCRNTGSVRTILPPGDYSFSCSWCGRKSKW